MSVSRETQYALDRYADLLTKWNPRINLVASSTIKDVQTRHFEDSLQVASLRPSGSKTWVDLGSGGGFPGAVVAIVHKGDLGVTLVESDTRKATFLRTVSRETNTPFTVLSKRIEAIPSLHADVVSARALAPLPKLLAHVDQHMQPAGTALFQKGESWREEVLEARKQWHFSMETHTSVTNPNAVILEIGDLSRV